MTETPLLLHVFPGFGPGGTQLRMVSIINSLGRSFAHRIISLDRNLDAARSLSSAVDVVVEGPLEKPGPMAFRKIAATHRPAAVLTYNWGAIEATLGARIASVCPVIHNECGFLSDEAHALLPRRVWTRRVLLNRIFRTAVTSGTMLNVARREFRLAPNKVQLIRTGVDVARFRPSTDRSARTRWNTDADAVLFGYLGGLRPEKNLSLLIRAFHAAAVPKSKLILAGEGACRAELEHLSKDLGVNDRVILAGHQPDPAGFLAALDVFVMSSLTEQVSNAQLEAMACGLPVICTAVGDSGELLGEAADGCVIASGDETAYTSAIARLGLDEAARETAGAANRIRAVKYYSKDRMVSEYGALFESAVSARHSAMPHTARSRV